MKANEDYVNLRNFVDSLAPLVYYNGESYTENSSAAAYDRLGSCTNCFIKCEDGFVEYPF